MTLQDLLSILLQFIVGIFIVYVLYVVCLWTMASDRLVTASKVTHGVKKKTKILTGWIDCSTFNKRTYSTVLPSSAFYVDIKRSVNRKGGTQFSYSFWMFIERPENLFKGKNGCNTGDAEGNEFYLFAKGDGVRYDYMLDTDSNRPFDYTVACPAICLGDFERKNITVKFNTLAYGLHYDTKKRVNFHTCHQRVVLQANPSFDETLRQNIMSLTPRKWVMYTFVFMDNIPLNDFENGIIVKTYINDSLYQLDRFETAILENYGDMNLLPDGEPGAGTGLRLSDLCYFNYALSDIDVANLHTRGVSKNQHSEVRNDFGEQLELSSYNRLDIHNL